MASLTFTIEGSVSAVVTVTEVAGDLVFAVELTSATGTVGDLRALFFDVSNEALLSGLSVAGADVTDSAFVANTVKTLGGDANINGQVVNEFGAFDAGVELGTAGMSANDIRSTQFVLSHSTLDLTLDLISQQDFGIRITSVGEDGGVRTDSLKLGGEATAAPNAIDDTATANEDNAVSGNVLANDTDADSPSLTVSTVAGGAVGSAFAVTSAGGRIGQLLIDSNGAFTFSPLGNFNGLAVGESDTITVGYTASDGTGGSDTATLVITVTGTNDAPAITTEAGDSAGTTLAETNAGLTATGTLTASDADVSDIVTASVIGVTHSGPVGSLSAADLLSFFQVTSGALDTATTTSGQLTWNFNSGAQAFDFLAVGETLTLSYTIRPDDGHGSVVQVSDINPGVMESDPHGFTVFNGELYFSAHTDTSGYELWKVKADGSVVQVSDINPGASPSDPQGFTVFNGELYFAAGLDTSEVWKVKADGSVVQVSDINPGAAASYPQGFTVFNGELYFNARNDTSGLELWKVKADGGVVQVSDINPGVMESDPHGFTVFNGELYFSAHTDTSGYELWKVKADGSVVQVSDINPGASPSDPQGFTVFNGELYFAAGLDTSEVWKVKADGSVVQVSDINPGAAASYPQGFTVFNGELYFNARNDTSGLELWKVKADGSVVQVSDINPGVMESDPHGFTVFNGELYFSAHTDTSGYELWKVKADGSVVQVSDINPGASPSDPQGFTVFNGELYFAAGLDTSEVWKVKADGSVVQVSDINPGANPSYPQGFTVFNGELYFNARNDTSGLELWKVKADATTELVADSVVTITITGTSDGAPLFTEGADTVNFNTLLAGSYLDGTQYNALGGNDLVTLPTNAVEAAEAGYVVGTAFVAGDGSNNIIGGSLDDTIIGGTGFDRMEGRAGNDTLLGGAGNDQLIPGLGDDFVDGGAGTGDGVTFSLATTVDLAAGTATGAEGTDTILGIEFVTGSNFSDTIIGNAAANNLSGQNGNDTIDGGLGNDVISEGLGDDVIDGGGGADRVTYQAATGSVTVDMSAGTATGANGNDTLINIEQVFGSRFNDTFFGGSGRDEFRALAGDDHLIGGAGDDGLEGDVEIHSTGAVGNDILEGGLGNDGLVGGFGDDTFVFRAGWGVDTVQDFGDGVDVVDLRTMGFTDVSQLSIAQVGAHTEIDFGGGDLLRLNNVNALLLSNSDFVFV